MQKVKLVKIVNEGVPTSFQLVHESLWQFVSGLEHPAHFSIVSHQLNLGFFSFCPNKTFKERGGMGPSFHRCQWVSVTGHHWNHPRLLIGW